MTMSRLEVARGSRRTRVVFARFLLRPDGLSRSLSRTMAEAVRERFQAKRQQRLDIVPRVHRSWTFAGLRAFSNGILRDLNTAIVAEEMMRGVRSIYVDYVDYDEIAHHAGGTRLESLAALTGLDQVVAILERVAERRTPALSHHPGQRPRSGDRRGLRLALGQGTQRGVRGVDPRRDHGRRVQRRRVGPGRLRDRGSRGRTAPGCPKAARRGTRKMAPAESGPARNELIVLASGNLGSGLRAEPDAVDTRGHRAPVARPRPRPGCASGHRLRRCDECRRTRGDRRRRPPPSGDRRDRGRRSDGTFGAHAAGMLLNAAMMVARLISTSTASWTRTRWRSLPSSRWSGATAAWAAGRTAAS